MMMAVSNVFDGVNVSAATPKLTANQVYDSTTMIKMWVVDQQASTKKELVCYECSCGAIKGK